jgi:hypothetical protein
MMTIRVKVLMTLEIDPEDYPVPSDGRVSDEIEEYVKETFYEIEGVKIKNMKLVSEDI